MATMAPRTGGGGRGPGGGSGGGDDRRGGGGGRGEGGAQGGKKKFFYRRKRVCKFCVEKIEYIDFKDVKTLQQFIPERGKILPRRISGTCALHQRKLQNAIKRARIIALLPFSAD
jgi:small subunit ribosomal protein S18